MQFHLLLGHFHIQQVHVLFLMKILEKQQTILNRQAYLEKEVLVKFLKVSWMMELLLRLRGLLVEGVALKTHLEQVYSIAEVV
jgi:hypothetical protein